MSELTQISTATSTKTLSYPILFTAESEKDGLKLLKKHDVELFDWQLEKITGNGFYSFETKKGILGVLIFKSPKSSKDFVPGQFNLDDYSFYRDNALAWLKKISFSDFTLITDAKVSKKASEGFGVGVALGSYSFKKERSLKVTFPKANKDFEQGVKKGHCVNDARYLVDTPPNVLQPGAFKDIIVEEFDKVPNFKVKVLDKKKLIKDGYGMISAVGQASVEGPYLVHVSYRKKGAKKTYAGVGKGITFDTGGTDLKPAQFMRWMKKDMGGAAALFGLAKSVKTFKPDTNFDFVFALAENSVSSNAFRPGDVLQAQNGMSVEIHNTDAEGRLALGSGLNYLNTLKTKFDACFDVATLTGAIKVGLGDRVGGLFSNSQKLGASVYSASEASGDPLWLMPLPRWVKSKLNSPVADIVNCTDGYGGAISAAEFLRFFVPEETPWFHMDLFAWTDGPRDAFATKGATGQGVQALQKHFLNI